MYGKTLELEIENKIAVDEPAVRSRDVAGGYRAGARRAGWRSVLLAGAAVAALAVVGDFGWNYWNVGRFQVSTDDAYVQADTMIIAPKVSGYLREVLVRDNQKVKAGQPLARIDERDYAVALEQAEADAAAARAEIDNVLASLDQQQAVIGQARSTVEIDQAHPPAYAQQDNDRYISLARTGAGSVQNEQQAVSKLREAQATLQRDTAAAVVAERQLTMLRAKLAQAQAVLAHDEAARDQAALNLSYTTIVAPNDGVVGNRTLRVGQYVQAGTQLMAIVPTDRFTWSPITRKRSSRMCASANRSTSRSTCSPAGRSRGMLTVSLLRAVRSLHCCRRTTRRGISLKSCSGSR